MITIFGAGLGPSTGIGFQLVNGQVPTSLGGTQVMVNGQPAPLLYSSFGQVNLILPYSLAVGTKPTIEVVSNGTRLNTLSSSTVQAADITIFQTNGAAAALNQDGTVNSPKNPAQPGTTVVLFGTGGGQTSPPSVEGDVTPPGLRPLVITPKVVVLGNPESGSTPLPYLNVQYAGAAPTLLSGVTQINTTLPDTIPAVYGYPAGTLPLAAVNEPSGSLSNIVTISVASQ